MRFYANENFPVPSTEALRALGHDVLTTLEAGNANQRIPDPDVLRYATGAARILITLNRRDFIRMHAQDNNHAGIVVCHADLDFQRLAQRVNDVVAAHQDLTGHLLTVPPP